MFQSEAAVNRTRGYSLIELLVVLAIVGILAIAGASLTRSNKGPAVEGVLNVFGGFLSDARKAARGSGTQIVLTPSGSGMTFAMQYSVANGPTGQYLHSAQTASNNYCVVVTDASTEPTATAITSLQASLLARQLDGVNLFTAGMWTRNLGSSGLTFNTNGTVDQEGLFAIASTTASVNSPVAIILVTSSGNMLRYYRPDSGSNWVRK